MLFSGRGHVGRGRLQRQAAVSAACCPNPHLHASQNQPLILGMVMLSLATQMLKLLYPGFAYVVFSNAMAGVVVDGALWVAVRWLSRVRS